MAVDRKLGIINAMHQRRDLTRVSSPNNLFDDIDVIPECQTIIVNSLADFCIWGSATPNALVMNIEGETVGYCSQKGHGTRIIPAGSITAAQVRLLFITRPVSF